MAMVPFYAVAGKRAVDETRTVTIEAWGALPADNYAFMEFYCDEAACDCRRVIFQVWRKSTPGKVWATITYGWEGAEYYAKKSPWMGQAMAEQMAGSMLEPLAGRTPLSAALLELFQEMLQRDEAYVARLKRHYEEACPRGGWRKREGKAAGQASARVKRRMRERGRG